MPASRACSVPSRSSVPSKDYKFKGQLSPFPGSQAWGSVLPEAVWSLDHQTLLFLLPSAEFSAAPLLLTAQCSHRGTRLWLKPWQASAEVASQQSDPALQRLHLCVGAWPATSEPSIWATPMAVCWVLSGILHPPNPCTFKSLCGVHSKDI